MSALLIALNIVFAILGILTGWQIGEALSIGVQP